MADRVDEPRYSVGLAQAPARYAQQQISRSLAEALAAPSMRAALDSGVRPDTTASKPTAHLGLRQLHRRHRVDVEVSSTARCPLTRADEPASASSTPPNCPARGSKHSTSHLIVLAAQIRRIGVSDRRGPPPPAPKGCPSNAGIPLHRRAT